MRVEERREGMGSGFPFNRDFIPEVIVGSTDSVVVAQTVLAQKGRPFAVVSQQDEPLITEFWDGHHARVRVRINGTEQEGYGSSASSVVEAYGLAFWEAVGDYFPQLRDMRFPKIREVNQDGHSHTELEFAVGSQRLVSRNGGLVSSSQEWGKLVAEGLMAAVHLTSEVKQS